MSTLIPLLLVALLAGCACGLMPRRKSFANSQPGTHGGIITRQADAATTTRHLIVKVGSDADHVALAGSRDLPLGVMVNSPSAAGDYVGVALFGSATGTMRMLAAEAVNAGDLLHVADGGKVANHSPSPGQGYIIGMALAAAGAGSPVEVAPCFPQPSMDF